MRTILIGLVAAALIAPGSSFAQAPLRSAVDPLAAPLSMTSTAGVLEGYSIDVLRAVEKELGRKIEVSPMQFSGVFPAMQAGNIDFVGPQVTATKARAETMLFAEGVIDVDALFLVPAKGPAYDTRESLRGKTIAVNKGTLWDSWARAESANTGWVVESYGSTNDAISAVLAGRAAATVSASPQALWAAQKNKLLKPAYLHRMGDVMTFAFRKDAGELRNEVDRAIECLKIRGDLAAIYKTWFGDAEPGPAVRQPTPGYGVAGLDGYDASQHEPRCKQ
jgi:polar amino acid transport system substrate-binding protein